MLSDLFRNMPEAIKNLLIINVLMFVGVSLFPQHFEMLALHYFESPRFKPHQLVTHIFMHSSFMHLAFNMIALVFFGSRLERTWGIKKFLVVYFVSAIGSFLFQMGSTWFELREVSEQMMATLQSEGLEALNNYENYINEFWARKNLTLHTGMVGASGAIMGILASFGYLFPNSEIYLYMLFPIKAKVFIPILIFMDLYLGIQNFEYDNVAHWAHIGGAVFGFVLVYFWNKRRDSFY